MKKNQSKALNMYKPNKQILYDTDHDKYYLKYDNDNKLYKANAFGDKAPQNFNTIFLSSYKDRILSHSMDKINFGVDNSLYRPQPGKFEGCAQFARPLVVPFTNVAQPKAKKYFKDSIGKVEEAFVTPKNKTIFEHKLNEGLDFYTGTINNISDKKSKDLFLKKINECLNKEKNEKNYFNKGKSLGDSELKALRNIRKKLLSNSTNFVNGRKLKRPSKKFIHKFKINYNIYFRNPIQKLKVIKTEKKDYFKELYETLNKEEVKQYLNSINQKTTVNNDINDSNEKKTKNIRYILSANKPGNKSQTRETRETFLFDDKDNNLLEQSKCLLDNNNSPTKDYFENFKNKKENLFSTIENNSSKSYKHLISKDYELNQKYFSVDNKPDFNHEKMDIRSLSIINKNYKLEKKLLTGYVKPAIKEELHLRKGIVKYKPFINIYRKELELYKMVNPIRYKLSEEKEEKEFKYLKKRLEKNREINSAYPQKDKVN